MTSSKATCPSSSDDGPELGVGKVGEKAGSVGKALAKKA